MKRFFTVCVVAVLVLGFGAVCNAAPEEQGSVTWVETGATHHYKIYSYPGAAWTSASDWIAGNLGSSWHLATITSAPEQGFFENAVLPFLSFGEFWLGGVQDPLLTTDPAANWTWVTGEPWSYTHWSSGEPNDARGWGDRPEPYLAIEGGGGWNDESFLGNIYGFVAESEEYTIAVTIDIHPGGYPNSINPSSKGVTPVAVLSTSTFDATTIDASTVRFGATGKEAAPSQYSIRDVDGNGMPDMMLQFRTQETGITCGMTNATLSGKTVAGQEIEGSDSVKTPACE